MNNMKVNSNSKLYNTTPTPTPPPSLQTPPSNTQSTHTSLKPKCSCLQPLFRCFSTIFNWIKRNIFRIKEKEVFSSNFRFYGHPIRCLSNHMASEVIRAKKENPKQFLDNIVDWFFRDPKAFCKEAEKLPTFPKGSEQYQIADFLKRQTKELWANKDSKSAILNATFVKLFLYEEYLYGPNENKKAETAIVDFVEEINQKYTTPENERKLLQLKNEQGDVERAQQRVMDNVD